LVSYRLKLPRKIAKNNEEFPLPFLKQSQAVTSNGDQNLNGQFADLNPKVIEVFPVIQQFPR